MTLIAHSYYEPLLVHVLPESTTELIFFLSNSLCLSVSHTHTLRF